jgi:23S rRNA pseudouridine2457 synthase
MSKLILFNKPFQVLCQFRANDERQTLADYIHVPDVYAAGRLDYDSEGLLILTDDGRLQAQISHPKHKLPKTYQVQVEGKVDDEAIERLRGGITLNDGTTRPCRAKRISPPKLWPRNPPIRERANIPTTWLELEISEGRNRQVRRMTAAVGHPTLRLVRIAIGNWRLDQLQPGEFRQEQVHAAQSPRRRPTSPRRKRV